MSEGSDKVDWEQPCVPTWKNRVIWLSTLMKITTILMIIGGTQLKTTYSIIMIGLIIWQIISMLTSFFTKFTDTTNADFVQFLVLIKSIYIDGIVATLFLIEANENELIFYFIWLIQFYSVTLHALAYKMKHDLKCGEEDEEEGVVNNKVREQTKKL